MTGLNRATDMQKYLFKIGLSIFVIFLILFVPYLSTEAHETDIQHLETEEDTYSGQDATQTKSQLSATRAIIYYNQACGMCGSYVSAELPEMLEKHGISDFVFKDYINDKSYREEMNQLMDDLAVPLSLQSHIMTFVGYKFILAGHVPAHIIDDLFKTENIQRFRRIIVYQDKMQNDVEDYKVWAIPVYADNFVGDIQTYPINISVTKYLDYLDENRSSFQFDSRADNHYAVAQSLLPMVLSAGFLDGLNPCAFAVLLFFIAFLFFIRKTRSSIWKMGMVYIIAIYLAYLSIGFGLTQAILFTNSPHFMAKLGAWLVIVLGVINLINHFFPRFPIKLRIPHTSKQTLKYWMYKATLPAAFVLGFLVGLCTFPCSGGIYVAIIGLLTARTTYWTGVVYMLLYNLMFVLPLIILLILASNRYAVEKLTKWEQSKSRVMRLLAAVTMIVLGLVILVWFV